MSAVPLYTAVPSGQYPPFAVVTDNDHRAWIIIAAAMGISFMLVALVTRVLIRKFVSLGWALDDTILTISTGVAFVQASLILSACADGLGTPIKLISPELQARIEKSYYMSNLLYLCALDLSKVSTILFLRRLMAPGSNMRWYCTILVGMVPATTVVFVLAVALQCDLSHPWVIVHQKCSGWFLRWEVQGAVSSLFEVAIFAAPIWLVLKLRKPLETKLEIVAPFALRLLIIVLTGLRLASFDQADFATDPTLRESRYICWTQAEMSYAVIGATLPTARRLVLDLITFYNGGYFGSTAESANRSGAYQMTKLTSRVKRNAKLASTRTDQDAACDDGDNNSQEMIIRKDITVEVIHEQGKSEPGEFARVIPDNWKPMNER
ncbi:uncharacterized protein PV07_00131 [Cladophialophora immunda]|uniref:Rhodopsin domain-containing protein n=1 Tax=Cladophialophora immunda TaxID=569365 RepID=A0A0D2DC10_9EURO|nr:uncharacterized protein PV07_00131 [Cladophialophora immunda]KIW33264.1 hypothetical protein PV07_00131 [Cladophialophora immunda]OQV11213.1 hypothetical protein CLAIMM_15083 isoform 5 [Cladophialophora immunda]